MPVIDRTSKDPMSQAVKVRAIKVEQTPSLDFPRTFELRTGEIEASIKPGDKGAYTIIGTIKSMHDDGTAIMRVEKVEHPSKNMVEKTEVVDTKSRGVTPTP